jgi:hypothetical protein
MLLLGAAGMWAAGSVYGDIFRRYTGTETGSYSDLSQRWLGTRVVLFEGGDPYSPALTPRIQEVYYGRVLQPGEAHRPSDPQAFSYPLPVVWLLAPLALLPFPLASAVFKLLAIGLLAGGTYAYLDTLNWPRARGARFALAAGSLLTIGGQASVRGDQITMVVYGLLLSAVWCAARGRYGLLGVLLALAWIKPQLALPLTAGLSLWAAALPERRRALLTGGATAAVLLAASEILLPGWIGQWAGTLGSYSTATTGVGGLGSYRVVDWLGLILRAALAVGVVACWWVARRAAPDAGRFRFAVAATLVVTMAVQQPWYGYNLVFLDPPALLLLAALRGGLAGEPAKPPRTLGTLALAVFALPWVVYPLLYAAYLAGALPGENLDWPGFAALYLVAERVLINFAILTLVFAYLAWAGPALEPPRSGRPAEVPAPASAAGARSLTNRG